MYVYLSVTTAERVPKNGQLVDDPDKFVVTYWHADVPGQREAKHMKMFLTTVGFCAEQRLRY